MMSIKRFILLCFLFFEIFPTKGQITLRNDIDKLRLSAATETNDSARIMILLDMGKYYIDIDNDSSMSFAYKAYLLSLQIKYPYYEAQCLDFMGAVAFRRGNADQSAAFLLKGLKIFEALKDSTFLIVANRNLGESIKVSVILTGLWNIIMLHCILHRGIRAILFFTAGPSWTWVTC